MSSERTLGTRWLVPALLAVLVLLLAATRRAGVQHLSRPIGLTILSCLTVALIGGVALLVVRLPGQNTLAPLALLQDAALLWITNVVTFALWYWAIDGGGPGERRHLHHRSSDFVFPQLSGAPTGDPNWQPGFIDYLFLAFNTSTALSPTDTLILSWRAKLLMMTQASLSLIMLAVLAARAINTL